MDAKFPPTLVWAARIGVFVVLALLPLVSKQDYLVHVASLAFIFGVAALGMQLLIGYAGLLSIGQAAFLGIGAYTSAMLVKDFGWPFELAFLAAGAVSAIVSLVLVPITRLRGIYLGVATLGFTIIVHLIMTNEEWLTGGTLGVMGIPHPSIGPWKLANEVAMYYLCLVILAIVFLALHRLCDSRFGRALQAIQLDEDAARASGVNITLVKSQCFIVAATVTGFAGSLFAHHAQYLNPNDFTFWKSIEILLMAAVGGIGSLAGAVVGAFIVVILPEALRAIDQWRMVIYGALLIVFMGLGPRGIAGLFALAVRRFLKRSDTATSIAKAAGT
ncbi:MAG: branched-chain amino acid ABC transporter permease [Burkholderiales bacterium]